jgi:MFS family permease
MSSQSGFTLPHAREIPIGRRVAVYLIVLIGYTLYCYNFVVADYVRPYVVSELGFSVQQTAIVSSAGNIGITVGAIFWASFVAWAGRRWSAFAIAAVIGASAAILAASNAFQVWVPARALLTAGLGGYYVVATGLVVALFPPGVRGKLIALNSAMYPAANLFVGLLGGWLGDANWHLLLWIGALPLPLALVLLLIIPSDRSYRAYDDHEHSQNSPAGSWREMLNARWRWLAFGCVALSGLDFNAYQLFQGFVTLYLKTDLGMAAQPMGNVVAAISTGSLVGSFFWAWVSDRWGRRLPLLGYLVCALAVLTFLHVDAGYAGIIISGIVFGFGLTCTTAWGPWFAEMFPLHLRPHGAALFHAGHILALGSPLFAAWASEGLGLTSAMSLAALVYVLGAALWFWLPETLGRSTSVAPRLATS